MFLLTSNLNLNAAILDTIVNQKNLIYISKFGLSFNIAKYIDFHLIFNNNHIDDSTIVLEISLDSYILNCFKSYLFDSNLVIYMILKVF